MKRLLSILIAFLFIASGSASAADPVAAYLYGFNGTRDRQVRIDASTRALTTITYEHHEIHGGGSYSTSYAITTAATSGHQSGIYMLTPATKEIHLVVEFSASVAANYSICEGITLAADTGTDGVAIYNRNRNSTKTSEIKDNATPQVANKVSTLSQAELAGDGSWACGTTIRTAPLEAGSGPKPAGGASRGSQEYILKKSTAYAFIITNTVATANKHDILLDWYEHTPQED